MAGNVVRNLYKLYVGNLPWTIGHNELRNTFGHVNSASVVFDRKRGLSKNFGFVIFSNREGYLKRHQHPCTQIGRTYY
ncbi:hypothetical protein NQ317_002983 [Molorchus minor]|uniref:RRM domain-containing protein n=1 Tax=Molorchus minor TaxID=1323400 RepID=A0ABQ9J6K9_9CUCU|nr:hypothetical protein NQ317_002983 [Molorchus minor]